MIMGKRCRLLKKNMISVSHSQIFPNADLRLLKQCVSEREKLLQKEYEKHKVQLKIGTIITVTVCDLVWGELEISAASFL